MEAELEAGGEDFSLMVASARYRPALKVLRQYEKLLDKPVEVGT